jgi:glutamyl-tRNA synthetase
MVITRFAPSPTGDPHIGNIRTALFNYLFARHAGGKFYLRIEDTDQNRRNDESVGVIKEALNWLDIVPDNIDEPIVQSERLEIYKKAAMQLVSESKAYVCNCSKERLDEVRATQAAKKQSPRYDNHCREKNLPYSEGCVVRMKVPLDKEIVFNDLIRGEIKINSNTLDDQVLLKSDGFPTYHLAHVIDDHEMQTSHVFRGEEWLSSAPKHIILFEMFGYEPPIYAHLPVILSPTKGKLSKRDGATTILAYKQMGYLPEALINFMALLGWNPKTNDEIFSLDNLIEKFTCENINKSPAVFDINKLNNVNRHYLVRLLATDKKRLLSLLDEKSNEYLESVDRPLDNNESLKNVLLNLIIPRINKLDEFYGHLKIFIEKPVLDKKMLIFRKSSEPKTKLALVEFAKKAESIDEQQWLWNTIEEILSSVVAENDLTNGDVFWSVRYALSGEEKSAPPQELATILGKNESLKRISQAIGLL